MKKITIVLFFLSAFAGLNPAFASRGAVNSQKMSHYQVFFEGCMASGSSSAEACIENANKWLDSKENSEEAIRSADFQSWLMKCSERTSITDCLMI